VEDVDELTSLWLNHIRINRIHPTPVFTDAGLMLGAGTALAAMARRSDGRADVRFDDGQRTFALLSAAYNRTL